MGLGQAHLASTRNVSDSARLSLEACLLTYSSRLASVGAMIMILSLAFDTFAQQLVGTIYHSIPVAQDQGVAQVARSDYYANYTEGFVHSGKSVHGKSPEA